MNGQRESLLRIALAERDLCIAALRELERMTAARYQDANRDVSRSKTLKIIQRVLRAMPPVEESYKREPPES